MLRSLITDPNSKSFMQPKAVKDMDERERKYVEVEAPARDRDVLASRLPAIRQRFQEDVRVLVEQDVVDPKTIAKKLGASESRVRMTLRELRLLD